MFSSRIGFFSLLADTGPVVLFVLCLLLFFSVLSWAIILMKAGRIGKAANESRGFLEFFFEEPGIDKVFGETEHYGKGSLARVFRAAYIEYRGLGYLKDRARIEERVARALRREANEEIRALSRYVPFLATVGNTAPFIGLFGTVWGIMNSFMSIGTSQSASLATVAPGIAEALVATAAGLAAAIPSVIAYNFFTQKINAIERDLEDFSGEFLKVILNEVR